MCAVNRGPEVGEANCALTHIIHMHMESCCRSTCLPKCCPCSYLPAAAPNSCGSLEAVSSSSLPFPSRWCYRGATGGFNPENRLPLCYFDPLHTPPPQLIPQLPCWPQVPLCCCRERSVSELRVDW